jgi:hypothetical protein
MDFNLLRACIVRAARSRGSVVFMRRNARANFRKRIWRNEMGRVRIWPLRHSGQRIMTAGLVAWCRLVLHETASNLEKSTMTVRTTRPSFAAPTALVFVFVMNICAAAAFQWTSTAEWTGSGNARPVTYAQIDGRTPVGGSIAPRSALTTSAAPSVLAPDSARSEGP